MDLRGSRNSAERGSPVIAGFLVDGKQKCG
jgi:hypothetical protein